MISRATFINMISQIIINMAGLKGWGVILVIIGVGSWILPLFGLQFKFLTLFSLLLGVPGYVSSLIFIAIGAVLYYLGSRKGASPQKK